MKKIGLIFLVTTMVVFGCEHSPIKQGDNPLLKDWVGPYQGLPPLDRVRPEHFEPALKLAMKETGGEVQRVSQLKEPPTFENTLVPLEKAFAKMSQVESLFYLWTGNLNTSAMQEVEKKMKPELSAFWNEVRQNRNLYKRLKDIKTTDVALNSEQKRLVKVHMSKMKKAGAALDSEGLKAVSQINKRMSQLQIQFSQNLLKEEETSFLHLKNKEELKGLERGFIKQAAKEAKSRGLKGWVVANTRSAMEPFLTNSPRRDLREKAYKVWTTRGDQGNGFDNNELVREILELRKKRSELLGFKSYADWQLQDRMAQKPENALALMQKVLKPALNQLENDLLAIQSLAKKDGLTSEIRPWDYFYYAEKLGEKKYDFDMGQLKPYLQYENLLQAMLWSAGEHFGYEFKRLENIPVFHEDVFVYEVSRNGKPTGLIYFDPYQRAGKRSGAWMSAYRQQSHVDGNWVLPIVSNNTNYTKGEDGEPTLLTWSDAITMFHEFGHALHGLSSRVTYPSLAGAQTAVDFVELPSQFYENILSTPEALRFLKNEKGEPLPQDLVKKMEKASHFNQAFIMTEYLASALADLKLHSTPKGIESLKDFESSYMKELGIPATVQMRHRIPHFSHVFSGEYYSAAYYSYLWSDVLSRDAFASFVNAGGAFNKAKSQKFFDEILSVGNTVDPAQAYRNFRGQDPEVRSLLEAKGLVAPETKLPN